MKKVLSFVLVLAMILGSVSMAFAAPAVSTTKEVTKDNTAVPFADAQDNKVATILRDLGAINGDNNGNCKPADEITRAEAAALVVIAMGLGDQGAVKTATKFADVDKDAWYSGYVAVAAAQGYVGGYAGNFNPDTKMSKDEVAALLLKVLGYSDEHLEGAWPANFRDLALAKGLLVDVEVGSDVATRQDMFQFLYNCLDQDMVTWQTVNATGGQSYAKAPNGLKLIQKMTGKQTAMTVYTESAVQIVTENTKFANKFDASAYYGKQVKLLQKITSTGTYNIGIAKVSSDSVTGKFAAANYTTFTAVDGTVYKNVPAVATVTDIFINGGVTTASSFTPNKNVEYTLDVQFDKDDAGKIATINAIHFERIDATLKVNVTEAALIADANLYKFHTSTDVRYAFDNFGTTDAGLTRNLNLDTKKYPLTVEGAATTLAEIKEDDIVEIYNNANTGYITKIVVTRNVVTGPITNYDSKNAKYTLGGKAYSIGTTVGALDVDATNVAGAIKGATEVAFYLNAAGKVALIEFVDDSEKLDDARYAIVLEAKNTAESVLENKVIKTTTNNSIRLLPVDTMVEEKFELISAGAMTTSTYAFTDANTLDLTVLTAGAIIKFQTRNGELKAIEASDLTVASAVTFAALGISGGDTHTQLFGNVKIVVNNAANNKTATQAAYYAVKTVEEMKKITAASISYKLDDNDKLELVIVTDYSKEAAAEAKITAAAIVGVDTDATGIKVTFLQPGAEATETLYLKKNATVDTANINAKKATLFALTLEDGKIATATDITPAPTTTDAAVLTYANGVFKNIDTDAVVEKVVDGVIAMKYNDASSVAALENIDMEDINDILPKAKKIDFYKVYNADFVDVVVIY